MAGSMFDYVIVGAVSAGCVLANRLSEDANVRVALIEAGGKDRNPWIHVPAGYYRNFTNPDITWQFGSGPEPHLNNRIVNWPRGRVLGGSSAINGLLYVRGDGECVTGLYMPNHKHWSGPDERLQRSSDSFRNIREQLAEYFAGERREFEHRDLGEEERAAPQDRERDQQEPVGRRHRGAGGCLRRHGAEVAVQSRLRHPICSNLPLTLAAYAAIRCGHSGGGKHSRFDGINR